MIAQVLNPCHPQGRHVWMEFWFLTLAWFYRGCCGHLRSERASGRISLFNFICVPLPFKHIKMNQYTLKN